MRIRFVSAAVLVFGFVANLASAQVTKESVQGISNFSRVETTIACAGATSPSAVAEVKRLGYASIINLRQANEQGADVIAMTTHGRTGLARIVSGSVTSRVIKEAGCPVLAVRRPASSTNQRTGPCRHVPEPVRQRTLAALSPALRRQHRIQPSLRFRD